MALGWILLFVAIAAHVVLTLYVHYHALQIDLDHPHLSAIGVFLFGPYGALIYLLHASLIINEA